MALASQFFRKGTHGDRLHVLVVASISPVGGSQFVFHILVNLDGLEVLRRSLVVKVVGGGDHSSLAVASLEVSPLHFDVSLPDVECVVAVFVDTVLAVGKRIGSGLGYI